MQISKDKIPRLVSDFFKKIPDSGINSITSARQKSVLVDNTYSLVFKNEIQNIIRTNPLIVPPIENHVNLEISDCDDYALQLKASLTALYRQNMINSGKIIMPPAIGIVITQNHAINIVLCRGSENSSKIFLIDPNEKNPVLTDDSEESASLLKTLPIRLLYL